MTHFETSDSTPALDGAPDPIEPTHLEAPMAADPNRQADKTAASDPCDSPLLARELPRLAGRWQQGELADAEFAAAYFLVWQIARHGDRYAARSARTDPRPDAAAWLAALDAADGHARRDSLGLWLERYQFLGIIPNVPRALLGWLRDGWSLRLYTAIPGPLDVLKLQTAGSRPATVIADWPRAGRPVLGKKDGGDFLVHDLEHAWKFFHAPDLHRSQRRFFGLLLNATEAGLFEPYRREARFSPQFDYLISDMNTHPVHGLRYLAAILIECVLRREGKDVKEALSPAGEAEMAELLAALGRLWQFPEPARTALARLLRGGFAEAEARSLENQFTGCLS